MRMAHLGKGTGRAGIPLSAHINLARNRKLGRAPANRTDDVFTGRGKGNRMAKPP